MEYCSQICSEATIRRNPTAPLAVVTGPLHQPEPSLTDTQYHVDFQGKGPSTTVSGGL